MEDEFRDRKSLYDNERTGAIDARSKDEIIFTGQVNSTVAKIADMLVAKNKAYGNSALNPVRVFSKASPQEQLLVRIDDKLSRLARGNEYPGDDTIDDLIGYLIILKIAKA